MNEGVVAFAIIGTIIWLFWITFEVIELKKKVKKE